MLDCPLCRPLYGPVLRRGSSGTGYWNVWLNRNQNLLGKCLLVLVRHEVRVDQLTHAEWADLQECLMEVTQWLRQAFAPDHFNYAFLQNQDRHVHLHVIPRYAAPREVGQLIFTDPDYPDHYRVPAPPRHVSAEVLEAIGRQLHASIK